MRSDTGYARLQTVTSFNMLIFQHWDDHTVTSEVATLTTKSFYLTARKQNLSASSILNRKKTLFILLYAPSYWIQPCRYALKWLHGKESFWEANSCSVIELIFRFLSNPNFYCRVHKGKKKLNKSCIILEYSNLILYSPPVAITTDLHAVFLWYFTWSFNFKSQRSVKNWQWL